jgi:ATP-dependent DNA helicase RecQ
MRDIEEALKKYWGFDAFLPLQQRAMARVREGRDSIVVMPTGGGKSLCFQAPAVTMPGMALVVSPLISLMKDQVDALKECGVPAARLDSTLSSEERKAVFDAMRKGELKLLYISPERIVTKAFIETITRIKLSLIAIDEAHCVSMWGHDFRPEYRALGFLKQTFPGLGVHAYTATATDQVRQDIARQLRLEDPEIIVGSFDRPNLLYRAERRVRKIDQICRVLDQHRNESGIIYCIKRTDVDGMCEELSGMGYRVLPYHAGMDNEERKKNQDAFIREEADTIVATIAFGMGIDKSNVRYVIHAGMPKSLEHYQQESGRAGRDGLEAECPLFYSGGDYATWKSIIRNMEPEAGRIALDKLNRTYQYCAGIVCRHRAILNYFGQDTGSDNCAACDVCLGHLDCLEDSLTVAQKILSCVLRLNQAFGGDYTASVLTGSRDQRILGNGHDRLSTYGLLSEFSKRITRDWIEQLAAQGFIGKSEEYNVLSVTKEGWQVLKGEKIPRLLKPAEKKPARVSKAFKDSWEDVDRGLFEALRALRSKIANSKGVPAYVVFGDASLRDMARHRPATREEFLMVRGVGDKKNEQYGTLFLSAISEHMNRDKKGKKPSTP